MKFRNLFLLLLIGLVSLFSVTDASATIDYNDGDFDQLEQLDYEFTYVNYDLNVEPIQIPIQKDAFFVNTYHYFIKSVTDFKPLIDYEIYIGRYGKILHAKKNISLDLSYKYENEDMKYCACI